MQFTVSQEEKTESQQFTELQRKWMQVVEDIKEVDLIKYLDNPIVIQGIADKLPTNVHGD